MRLRTFGNLLVEGSKFKRPKPLLLLSYLAVEGAKERRYLSQVFWPNTKNRSHSLSKAIYRIKQGLTASDKDLPDTEEWIQNDDQTVSTCVPVDVLELLDHLEKENLQAAVELYQGEFLASVNIVDVGEELEQWILQTREYVAKRMQQAYLTLAQQQRQLNNNEEMSSLHYAEKAYKVLDSSLSTPDVIEALYKELKLNNSPLAETLKYEVEDFGISLAFMDESVGSVASTELAHEVVDSIDEKNLGFEKGTSNNFETNFESAEVVGGVGSQNGFNVQSLLRIDNRYLSKFIGREKEISEVITLFKDEQVRLLSLIGIGGSGKTRMAMEIAKQTAYDPTLSIAIQEYFFVDIQNAETALAARLLVAETIGLEPDLNEDIVNQLVDHIGQRSLLVIIDGFERLSGEAGSLPELLHRCPNLYLIVTSRERLNLAEEWILHIRGLTYRLDSESTISDQSVKVSDLEAWQQVDSVRFFSDRAKQADVRFRLEDNLEGVVELCNLVAGLPLALELAATWVRHMPCKQIVAEIKQSLDILYRDTQYVDDHHTSIRAVFEHSWQLLTPREETIFASLTIFKQGFRREAAAVVADASILQLAVFLDKSLLTLDSSGRYHCHPLLKQFMAEKVTELKIDNSILASKHADFYNNYLLKLQTDFQKDIDKVVRFREDFENFGAAWYQTIEEENFQTLQRLLPAFKVFLEHLHRYNDAIEPINQAVQKLYQCFEPKVAETHPALLDFRVGQAWAYGSSDYTQAEIFAKESIDLATNHDNDFAKGLALRLLGEVALEHKGDKVTARAYFDQALAIAQRTGNIELSARCWRYLAVIAVSNGDNEAALEFQRTALKHFENLGDKMGIADCRCEVGHLLVLAKRSDEAEVYLVDSLKLSREMDFKLGIVNSLCFLGDVAYDRKQFTKAEEYYNNSLELSEQIHDYYGVAGGYMDLATIAAAQQNIAKANQYFYQALDKAIALGVKPLQLSILTHVAILQLEHSECSDDVEEAIAILKFIEKQDETDQYDKDLIKEQYDTYKEKFKKTSKKVSKKLTVEHSLVDYCVKTLKYLKDYDHKPAFELVV